LIGEPHHIPQFSGSKRRLVEKQDSYQYVPLLASLKALLSDRSVQEQVQQLPERVSSDGTIKDFRDGSRFKNHPLFSQDPFALQIVAHYDELEVCNPLGSHVKTNKVGIVSYTLGNIHPKYRSKMKMAQLAIVATVPVIEAHGLHTVIKLPGLLNLFYITIPRTRIFGINKTTLYIMYSNKFLGKIKAIHFLFI